MHGWDKTKPCQKLFCKQWAMNKDSVIEFKLFGLMETSGGIILDSDCFFLPWTPYSGSDMTPNPTLKWKSLFNIYSGQ